LAKQEVEQLRGETTGVILKRLGVTPWKLPGLARGLRNLAKREHRRIPLFEGVGRTLRELAHRGATLGVVSSNSREHIEQTLGLELAPLIRHYECGVSLFGKFPRLRRILRRSGIAASAAIFVGDELRDHDAARKAGVAFGAVAWGYARPEVLRAQSPAEMFSRVGEIVAKLR
jgi:phosphoglycolate phosphatase